MFADAMGGGVGPSGGRETKEQKGTILLSVMIMALHLIIMHNMWHLLSGHN